MLKKKLITIIIIFILALINLPFINSAIDEGYGEANNNLGQFTDSFENDDNVSYAYQIINNVTLECIELNHTTMSNLTVVYAPIQLREHKYYASYNPNVIFTKVSDYVDATSSTAGLGQANMFIVANREWLDGKYLRWKWRHIHYSTAYTRIYDGEYSRDSEVDFPYGSEMISKGNGLLQILGSLTDTGSSATTDTLIDVSGGSEDNVTIFVLHSDGWSSQTLETIIYWFEINEGAGGADNLLKWDVNTAGTSLTMEQTGTYKDYGRVDGGDIEDYEITIGGYYTEGYFNTTDYFDYVNGSSLVCMVNSSIPSDTTLKIQFSNDGINWFDNNGISGSNLLLEGFYSLDLRDLNYTNIISRYNFTGTPTLTPRLYQSRLVTTNGGVSAPSEDYAGLLIIGLIIGLILGIGVSRS